MIIWLALVFIIAIGIALIVVEIIFVPGTTVVGIIGLICIIGGVLYGFQALGNPAGWKIAFATFLVLITAIAVSLKSGVWSRFSLKNTMESKVNDQTPISFEVGKEGITVSALKPVGNAEFDNEKVEVTTLGEFVNSETKVRVTQIEGRIIYVEQLNN